MTQPTRTADTDSRHGQPTRTADTDSRHGQQRRRVQIVGAALLTCAACAGPEPEFHPAYLSDETPGVGPHEDGFGVGSDAPPDLEAIRAAGLESILSEGPPPPPFHPEPGDGHYAEALPSESPIDVALRDALPLLVDVVSITPVEAADRDMLLSARELASGDAVEVLLPEGYVCSMGTLAIEGQRYVVFTSPVRNEAGQRILYIGPGATRSILPVDERGMVATGSGWRDAAELAATPIRSGS